MNIRLSQLPDLERLTEVDATIESLNYLHIERTGEGLESRWQLIVRPLPSKLIESNALTTDVQFEIKQLLLGVEDGICIGLEMDGELVAHCAAKIELASGTLRIVDIRVDYDQRRQGIASAMLFQLISAAREKELRAVAIRTDTRNHPMNTLLSKLGFDLAGLDTHLLSNHDLLKESVALFWYMALD